MRHSPPESLVGVDIGSSVIRVVVADFDERGVISIVGTGESPSQGVREGIVYDRELAHVAVADALSRAKDSTGNGFNKIIVGLSGCHFASLNTRGVVAITRTSRTITHDDVDRATDQAKIIVLPPDREIAHCIPRTFLVDGQAGINRPAGMHATRLEVDTHIVTGSGTVAQNTIQTVVDAGYSVGRAVLTAIAIGDVILTHEDKVLGALSINVGAETTELAIFKEGSISYSSVIPCGSAHLTKDISKRWRISYDDAESIKIRCSQSADVRLRVCSGPSNLCPDNEEPICAAELDEFIRNRADEIAQLVRLELIKSGYYNLLPAGIVLSGGGAKIIYLPERLSQLMHIPVRMGFPKSVVFENGETKSDLYSAAIGLVHYAATTHERVLTSKRKSIVGSRGVIQQVFSRFRPFFD